MMHWTEIEPNDAVDINVNEQDDIEGPLNETGEECPWPWEPQQLKGAPMGQYYCGYCGAMVMAGMQHIDYRDQLDMERFWNQTKYIRSQVSNCVVVEFINGSRVCSCGLYRGIPPNLRE